MKARHINMDNYEEFFLLYVDNELTPPEKGSVEQFLALHPELRAELDMLMDTRLTDETVHFSGKDSLFVTGDSVNAINIEELQVQWLDGELDADMAARVEDYTASDPKAAADLEWLKKTKLPAEHIAFPDKASLYRTEKRPAALVQMPWKRMAVAAAIILAAGLFWINREVQDVPEAVIARVEDSTTVQKVSGDGQDLKSPTSVAVNGNRLEEQVVRSSNDAPAVKQAVQIRQNAVTNEPLDRIIYASVDPVEEKTEVPVTELTSPVPNITAPAAEENQARESLALSVKSNYASDALNNDHGVTEEEYADEDHKQRKGLRGIVRKVNRFYNKATNPDPDKATVKVANFEIGLPR